MNINYIKMDELNALIEWLKTEKGIIKITLEDLMELVPEYELWKQRN
jgi:hypothetical protein